MTLQQLQTKANAKLTDFWTLLVEKQDAYFAKHGKYFQLLVTNPVVDGVDTAWELRTPSDELNAIDVDFIFNSPIPFSIMVNEWVGPNGDSGFSASAIVELPNGTKYRRSRQNDNVDTGWYELIEEIV